MELSKRSRSLSPSVVFVLKKKALEFKKQGCHIISFGAGEPDFDTPSHIKKAAVKALNQGFTKYTPVSGILELKKAIIQKFKKDNGLNYKPDEIIVSCGAKQAIFNALFALLDEGNEVIIPAPFWLSYPEMVKSLGGKPVFVKTKNYKLTPGLLSKVINKRSKVLILNSPSNPTGAVYSKKELESLTEIILKKNLFVISDEIYEKILYNGTSHISIASLGKKIQEQTMVVNGVSKSFAMTGWRIGYAAGPKKVIAAMSAFQSHTTSSPCSFAQYGALTALLGKQKEIKKMTTAFTKRRQLILDELLKIKDIKFLPPQGAFYVLIDISKWNQDSFNLAFLLLKKEKLVVIPGKPFGAEGFIRLSFATSEENIKEGVKRLKRFLERC